MFKRKNNYIASNFLVFCFLFVMFGCAKLDMNNTLDEDTDTDEACPRIEGPRYVARIHDTSKTVAWVTPCRNISATGCRTEEARRIVAIRSAAYNAPGLVVYNCP